MDFGAVDQDTDARFSEAPDARVESVAAHATGAHRRRDPQQIARISRLAVAQLSRLQSGDGRGFRDLPKNFDIGADNRNRRRLVRTVESGRLSVSRLLLVFGYLGPLSLVSLVTSRREFVKWHAKQGLVLSALLLAVFPVLRFLDFVLDRFFWAVFGELFWIAIWMIVLGVVLAMLTCIIRGLEGERFKLPILGELADKL